MDDRTHRAALSHRGDAPPPPELRWVRSCVWRRSSMHARQCRSAAEERQALLDALAASQAGSCRTRRSKSGDDEADAILAFQIALLEDDNLISARRWRGSMPAARASQAWSAAIDPEIASYDAADDPYFRARGVRLARSQRIACCDIWQAKPTRSCRPALSSRPTTCRLPSSWPPIGVMVGWYCAGEAPAVMLPSSRGRAACL